MRQTIIAATLAAGGMLAATHPANAAAYTFTTIDVPGAGGTSTRAQGINDAGQIVGAFQSPPGSIHGFLDSGGSFTQIDVPGAPRTDASGINATAQIVGTFEDNAFIPHGFL